VTLQPACLQQLIGKYHVHVVQSLQFFAVHLVTSLFSYGRIPFATVEDVSDLWLNVKESFERRLPVKKACLNNKAWNPVFVENLLAEFIQTTDSRLRSRFPQEQYLFWFREPYATVVLVTCEVLPFCIFPHGTACCSFSFFFIKATIYLLDDHLGDFCCSNIYENMQDLDEFKTILKPRLKLIVQNDEREWFIVFVSKAHPSNDQATKMAKKVYARLEADFNTKKRERYFAFFSCSVSTPPPCYFVLMLFL
jgi:trafficking protein particle complex subunit 10